MAYRSEFYLGDRNPHVDTAIASSLRDMADTEWAVEMAPTFAGTRAEYSTIANDASRVHHVLSDPDAHPDDRYALENKMMLMGMYMDREQEEMPIEEAIGPPLEQATMYLEKDAFGGLSPKRARVPHLGSARAGLLKGQVAKPGHAYMFQGIYNKEFQPGGQWETKDPFGQGLVYDPKDTIRHEIGHDTSREFMHMMQIDYEKIWKSGGRPHKDTIGAKFVDRVGFNNVSLFFEMDDGEELLNRYEDFLVGSPAKRQMAREYMDNFVKETTGFHRWSFEQAESSKNRLKELEERFTQENLDILYKYKEYQSMFWSLGDEPKMRPIPGDIITNILDRDIPEEYLTLNPSSLLEGLVNKDEVDELISVIGDIWDFENWVRESQRNLDAVKIIPKIYDAQMKGLRELKESGQTLGSPPFTQTHRNR